ncbi:LysR family transcriptional regulator [Microvirga massiliensis]|uniref:LysR family transcriptional regulator n=1 Tax=Microvirga massiliensis TaxID=1033741 RepID=UPI00062BF18F|nr:LysR family transcriptional regulator [Microvirga massiliensis]
MAELDDLRCFVEVVESGGFGRAAKRLGISKSIVSRRIARLEADLGARLLSRTTRGVSPTEAGLEFKARSERILVELEEAREAAARQGGSVVGRLRVSVPLSFGVRHVAPVLAELAVHHPKLEMDVSYSDRFVDLIGERFDAAIRIGTLKDSSLVARRIAPVRSVIVASPDYLALKGRPKIPSDLAAHECLIYTGRAAPDWQFRAGKRWISIRPEGRLRSDSGEAILRWAIAGLGIADAPSFLVSDAVESGALEPLLLDYPMPEHGLHIVRPPGAYMPGKIRVLIDALVERFEGEPDWDGCLMKSRRVRESGQGAGEA